MSYSTPATFAGQQSKTAKKQYAPLDWSLVDVVSVIEQHTSTRLSGSRSGKQYNGACPFSDCLVDTDGFIVWPDLSKRGQHYYCRGCGRSGDVINLLQELHGWSFTQAKSVVFGSGSVAAPAATRRQAHDKERQEELDLLRHLYPRMRAALVNYERPQVYLQERGITLAQAQSYGLGYVPFTSETADKQPVDGVLKRWQGRIIFPLGDSSGALTFAGRTLYGWKRGMSPEQHKAWLAEHASKHVRTLKTSPRGYFGYSHATTATRLVLCEGEFDALSLLIAGVEYAIACAQHFSSDLLPFSCESVILAMDVDESGKKANQRLAVDLRNSGVETRIVTPGQGKDWNEMHVQLGLDAIREAFKPPDESASAIVSNLVDAPLASAPDALSCSACGVDANAAPVELEFHYDEEGVFFCPDCWERRQVLTAGQEIMRLERVDGIMQLVRGEIEGPVLISSKLREIPRDWSWEQWRDDILQEYQDAARAGEQARAQAVFDRVARMRRIKAS